MGPRDRPRSLPDGAACTACGAPVPVGVIRILARRDDLAFVELPCSDCGSTVLAMLVTSPTAEGPAVLDVAADEPASADDGPRTVAPITDSDVEAIRRDLAAWDGDLVGWLRALDGDGVHASVVER